MAEAVFLGSAYATIELQTGNFTEGISAIQTQTAVAGSNIGKSLSTIGSGMVSVGTSMTKFLTLPIVAGMALAVKSSSDFEQAMLQIKTQAGATQEELDKMTSAILNMAKSSEFGPTELANSLFYLESVGIRGAAALDALKAASEGAAVGGADLVDTTNALAGVLKTNILGAQNATEAMANLNAIVGAGKLHMEDLVSAMGTGFFAVAAQFGISLNSAGAALDFLTSQGIPATKAATQLRMMMINMTTPAGVAAKMLTDLGLSANDAGDMTASMSQILSDGNITLTKLSDDLRQPDGIMVALTDLRTHLMDAGFSSQQASAMIIKAMGGVRSGQAAALLSGDLNQLGATFNQIQNTSGNFASSVAQQQATMAAKAKVAWDSLQSSIITFGNTIKQMLIPVFESIAKYLGDLSDKLNAISPAQQKMVVDFLLIVAAAGPFLIVLGKITSGIGGIISTFGLFGSSLSSFGVALAAIGGGSAIAGFGIILAVIAAIVVAIVAMKLAWDSNFGGIRDTTNKVFGELSDAWNSFSKSINDALAPIGGVSTLITGLKIVFEAIGFVLLTIVKDFVGTIAAFLYFGSAIAYVIGEIVKFVVGVPQDFSNMYKALGNIVNTIIKGIGGLWSGFTSLLSNTWKSAIDGIVYVWDNFPYLLGYGLGLIVKTVILGVGAIITFFWTLPTNVWNALTSALNFLVGWSMSASAAAGNAGANIFYAIINWVSALPRNVYNWLASAVSTIWNWAGSAYGAAVSFGYNIYNGIASFVLNIPNLIVKALNDSINAVKSWINDAYKAATSWGSSFLKGFKDALGIHSPSFMERAMVNIGENLKTIVGGWSGVLGPMVNNLMPNIAANLQPQLIASGMVTAGNSGAINNSSNTYNITVPVGLYAGTEIEKRKVAQSILDAMNDLQTLQGKSTIIGGN